MVTRPPQLTSGEISPKSVKDFENHCLNYFINAKGGIENNVKVSHILGCFENDLINDCISVNRECFTTLSFENFMIEFHACWLPHNWEQNIRSKILSARLYPKKQQFKDWAAAVQSLNVSLCGTPSHLNDEHIHLQLEAGLNEDLQTTVRDAKAHETLSLHPWIALVKDLGDRRIIQCKHVAEAVEEAMRSNKKPFQLSSRYANTTDTKTTSASTSTTTHNFPLRLTEEERQLLVEHAGCFKCRKFYAGHCTHQCLVMCMAQPQAVSQAKPGQNSGFLKALARPRVLQSQSQAVRPWLVGKDNLPVFVRICGLNFFLYNFI